MWLIGEVKTMLYAVTAKCGHTGFGTGYFMPITFAVNADTARAAAMLARELPRVKHNHTDAIISVRAVQTNEFRTIRDKNKLDPFLYVKSIQEQRRIIPYEEIYCRIQREKVAPVTTRKIKSCDRYNYFSGKARIRNPHKYHRYSGTECEYLSRVAN